MAELLCKGMAGFRSIWVGLDELWLSFGMLGFGWIWVDPDELWLNWFARVWWIWGGSGWSRMSFG